MRSASANAFVLLAALALSAATSANTLTFNFNSLGNNASSSAIQTYMSGVAGSTVGVTGAIASNSYRGDGYVVGPSLGTSDGATSPSDASHNHAGVDTFIMNNGPGSNSFTLNFGTYTIYSLSFDWEIFPNGTCTPTCTGVNFPDMSLLIDNNAVPLWSKLGTGTINPQNIGVSGVLNLSGAHSLTFKDWPAEVGIDNLVINGCPSTVTSCLSRVTVPEPSTAPLVVLALGVMLLGGAARTRRQPKASKSR